MEIGATIYKSCLNSSRKIKIDEGLFEQPLYIYLGGREYERFHKLLYKELWS
ncbi:hypothetical protein D3C81_674750 [compost metagenome]